MKNRNTLLVVLVCILAGSNFHLIASFSQEAAGTAVAQFLKIPVGARAVALGEAYGAISNDATSLYWNPAGLGLLKQINFNLTYNIWLTGINHSFLGYAHPLKFATLGASINILSTPPIEKYDKYGYQTEEKTYTTSDMAISIGFGKEIFNKIIGGTNLKFIQSTIDKTASSAAIAVDLGIIYNSNNQSFCVTIQNLGTKLKFISQEEYLPLNIKIGSGWKIIPEKLIGALDINAYSDNDIKLNLGIEYIKKFSQILSVATRFGIRTNIRGLDPISAISFGFGIQWTILEFDFVWVPYVQLGDTMRISLGIKFGNEKSKPQTNNTSYTETTPPTSLPVDNTTTLKKQYFTEGQQYFKNKEYKKAIDAFKKVLEIDPQHKESAEYIKRAQKELMK
ncbi:MAG: PorV/PorQ family protein [Endomicrobia bacterium]|nr:PorV/PorQ family protein [Endomicrobiia bacterium]